MSEQNGILAKIWLLVLREGGRWSTAEIADELNDSSVLVGQVVRSMADSGYLVRFAKGDGGDRVQYGITITCKVPRGITLKDVLESGLAGGGTPA